MKLVINNESPISQLDLDSPLLEKRQPINRFVMGSILLHVASAVTILMLKPTEPVVREEIEIELAAGTPSTIVSAPVQSEILQEAAPAVVAKATPPPAKAPVVAPVVAPVAVAPIVTPTTVEDIEAPKLEEIATPVAETEVAQPSNEDVQNQLNEKLLAAQAAEAQQLEQAQKQMQADLEKAQAQAKAQAAAEEQARVAQAQAAADAQAAAEAEAAAAALAAAEAAKAAEIAAQGNAAQSTAPTENVGELRSLAQLRQKPGNPRPSYEPNERLQGHNGAVIFKAFVTQDGSLKDFKMMQSSGYKNLDFKTLKALKQWKFYPGQEGWVELPFQWDLKGGPQEMPALLRRRVGQN